MCEKALADLPQQEARAVGGQGNEVHVGFCLTEEDGVGSRRREEAVSVCGDVGSVLGEGVGRQRGRKGPRILVSRGFGAILLIWMRWKELIGQC